MSTIKILVLSLTGTLCSMLTHAVDGRVLMAVCDVSGLRLGMTSVVVESARCNVLGYSGWYGILLIDERFC